MPLSKPNNQVRYVQVGMTGKVKYGETYVVLELKGSKSLIKFLGSGTIMNTTNRQIKSNQIKDPVASLYTGVINDVSPDDKESKSHVKWRSMISRVYSEKALLKRPTYKNTTVCDEWKTYSNFKVWFDANYIEGYHLDKDIKVLNANVYSPDTCIFLPQELNSITCVSDRIRGDLPLGVSPCDSIKNPYKADIRYRGSNGERIRKYIGCYPTKEDAFHAYREFKLNVIAEKAWRYFNEGKITEEVRDLILKYDFSIED